MPDVPVETAEIKPVDQLLADISEGIKQSGPTVRSAVVDHFVGEKIQELTELLVQGKTKLDNLRKELQRIKPDQTFDESGKVVSATYSKAKVEERKKALEKIDQLQTALNKAIGEHDFQKLREFLDKNK